MQLRKKNLKISLFFGILLSTVCLTNSYAQRQSTHNKVSITTTPLRLFFGVNLGVDCNLSHKTALGAEVTAHLWNAPANIAIAPSFKYFFKGNLNRGIYTNIKAVGGFFFEETAIDNHPYYAGGGLGIGGIVPLCLSEKVCLFGEIGVKYVAPFGERPNSSMKDGNWGMAYYILISPASFPELKLGLKFNL